jgi:hypothetical protein
VRSFHARVVAFATQHNITSEMALVFPNETEIATAERRHRRFVERRNGSPLNMGELVQYAAKRRRAAVTHPGKRAKR